MKPGRQTACLQRWDDRKGFGFVQLPDGQQAFVHISQFKAGSPRPQTSDRIGFALVQDPKGRWQAVHCERLDCDAQAQRVPIRAAPVLIALTILLAQVGGVWAGTLPVGVVVLSLLASTVSLGLYASDKSRAQRGDRRIPENTLHLWSLLGGWPGAWVAQQRWRHKTIKQPFQRIFKLTVLIHLMGVTALCLF